MKTASNEVCEWIKAQRKHSKVCHKKKHFNFIVDYEADIPVRVDTTVFYDINTGNVSFSTGLRYKRASVYPSVFKHLKCIDNHAISQYNKRWNSKYQIRFNEYIGSNIELVEYIQVYGEDLIVRSYFHFTGRRV